MYQEDTIDATGVFQTRQPARLLLIESIAGASFVTVELRRNGMMVYRGAKRPRGFRLYAPDGFDLLRVEAAPGVVVGYSLADEDIQLSIADGMEVSIPGGVEITNAIGSPVPVDVLGAVLVATGVVVDQKPAVVTGYAYTVTAAGVSVSTAANPGRRAIHFRNADAAVDCYLAAFAAAGKAQCPVLLMAGECLMIDDRSAASAWVAFSDGADIQVVAEEVIE